MGNAVVESQVVPSGNATDIAAKRTALDAQAGIDLITGRAEDLIVSADIKAENAGTKAVFNVHDGDATGGTFRLAIDGFETAAIAHNATAADVKAAVEALANVNLVTVTGLGTVASPYVITFDDPVGPRAVVFNGAALTGGTGGAATQTTAGVAPAPGPAQTSIDNAIAAVGGVVEISERIIEDPKLSAPANPPNLSKASANKERVTWQVTLSRGVTLRSIHVYRAALDAQNVPVEILGNPQDHDSQKNSENKVHAVVGPAPAGATNGSYKLALAVTDSNGRLSLTDEVTVTVAA